MNGLKLESTFAFERERDSDIIIETETNGQALSSELGAGSWELGAGNCERRGENPAASVSSGLTLSSLIVHAASFSIANSYHPLNACSLSLLLFLSLSLYLYLYLCAGRVNRPASELVERAHKHKLTIEL